MPYKLITVARLGTPAEAHLARSRLDAEGIRAFLADETMMVTAWHLGIAMGHVKLLVDQDDAEHAIAVIHSKDAAPIPQDVWMSEAPDGTSESDVDDAQEDPAVSPTEEILARAYRAAVLGWCFLPLQLYSLWLLLHVAFDTAPVSPENRRRVLMTLLFDVPIILACPLLLWGLFSG